MKANTIQTLHAILRDLKSDALRYGRYPRGTHWHARDKSAAFRCMAYNQTVLRVNALIDAIAELEKVEP